MELLLTKQRLTDEELVFKIKLTNDTKLFSELYDRFSQVVFNKCYSFSKSKEEAEDLMHDIFVRLYLKIESFKGTSKFSTWLYSFVYNHCVNYVQRDSYKKLERVTVVTDEVKELDFCDEVEDNYLLSLKAKKLEKALQLVDSSEKIILLMKYQDGMSIKEIQRVLNLGESAVKMRVKRAKNKIVEIYNTL